MKTFKMRDSYCKKSKRSSMPLLTIALIDFFSIFVAAEPTAVVMTTTGPVQGEILTTVNSINYAAFKGIPYAKPPLGYLRFKPPVAIDPWTKTLNTTVDGADCIQPTRFNVPHRPNEGTVEGSEDCLYINVNTPVTDLHETPRNLKSVMVYIFGGIFLFGSPSSESYHPDYLLEKDVVYVAANYRLGALGFLSLEHANATGNAGMKDQVFALKWVKANIEKFGGNPNNVTIFGNSAGSASVGYHVLSDASAGLFHGAISMSGVPLNPWAFRTPAKNLSRAKQLAALLGTISDDKEILLRTFYDATAEEIVQATSYIASGIIPFAPTLENKSIATDAFLTRCSVDKYNTGSFNKVPQIIGYADQEMVFLPSISTQVFVEEVYEALNVYDDSDLDLSDNPFLVKNLINTFTELLNELSPEEFEAVVNVTSDVVIAQVDQTQKMLANKNDGKPVYYYHVSFYTNKSLHNLNYNSTLLGAAHGDDLAFIFYYPRANYSTDPRDPMRRTIERVTTMWTNFAKYGNPTPHWVRDDSVKITWPDSGLSGLNLNIGNELTIGSRSIDTNMKLVEATSLPLLRYTNGC